MRALNLPEVEVLLDAWNKSLQALVPTSGGNMNILLYCLSVG